MAVRPPNIKACARLRTGNYGDSLFNPPISIAFGRPGCCRRGGRSKQATKSFEPRGRPARTESKASFAEKAFREEFWVANLTSAHGRILRLIRAPFVTSFREGQIARHQPRHGRNSQARQQISCQNYEAVLCSFSYGHRGGDRRADRRFLNRGVSIAGIAPDGKTESPGNGAATA